MLVDDVFRTLRYVELNESGVPIHSCFSSRNRSDEESLFGELVEAAARKGHTIVRLCNHEDNCTNPNPGELESDGRGGIRAKAEHPEAMSGVELWDESMQRLFVAVGDERFSNDVQRVICMEPGEWTQGQLDDGKFCITPEGVFDWQPHVQPTVSEPAEPPYKPARGEGGHR